MADTGSTPSHNYDTQSITLTLGREAGDRGVMCVSIRLGAALYCSAQREVPKSTNRIHVSTFGLEVLTPCITSSNIKLASILALNRFSTGTVDESTQ